MFFGKFFNKNAVPIKKIFSDIKELSILSNEAGKAKSSLDNKELEILMRQKDELFMSLSDFLEFFDNSNLKLNDVLCKFKNITELKATASVVEMYAITDDSGHIVLCPNTQLCEKHQNYAGQKIRIVTVRKS